MKRWGLFLAMLLSVSVVFLPGAWAADEAGGRVVYYSQKAETMEVGDVPGHVLVVVQQPGLIFHAKGTARGEIGTRIGTVFLDLVKGKGTYNGYTVNTFQDGSTLVYKFNGTVAPVDGGKKSAFEGPYEYIGGTGRFEGVKGKGTMKGERIGSAKAAYPVYSDFTGTEWR
ncbi:MAG: hypothetical protein ACYC34_05305 [Desulfobacteria bacterium]|nr:hypothetical protein [Deltaproteobacteria bacterium]